jgi:hypothetical protein
MSRGEDSREGMSIHTNSHRDSGSQMLCRDLDAFRTLDCKTIISLDTYPKYIAPLN